MNKLIALLVLVLPLFVFSQDASKPTKELVDVFSVEGEPGEGTLQFGDGPENSEKIQLGILSGHYGLGMVFTGKALPAPYDKDFKGLEVIQLALGTIKSKLESRTPQFAGITLMAKKVPTVPTTFQFVMPSEKKRHGANTALILFTSPGTPNNQTDEEKLQKTFFGQEGKVRITPVGAKGTIGIKSEEGRVTFYKQTMKLEFEASLKTPFSESKRLLTGTVQFPFYWAKGKAAETLSRKIASQSMTPPR